jgi:hypothetical protein
VIGFIGVGEPAGVGIPSCCGHRDSQVIKHRSATQQQFPAAGIGHLQQPPTIGEQVK